MTRRELQYAAGWGAILMALSCLPYAVVWWFTPLGSHFPGALFTSDDHGVYFSWMRQAADGQLLLRNLFTTEPQSARSFHALFLMLGWLSRLPGLDLPLAYHLGRIVCGILALVLIYRLGACFAPDVFARRCVFWTAALSSGLGWLFWADAIPDHSRLPVDVWQPEALIGTGLYVNAMYAAALALMAGFAICLLAAEKRGARWAVGAGVCGLLLGNIHSYDVIHLAAAWTAYLLARWSADRRFPTRAVGYAALAAVVASPAMLHMTWLYFTEPVFRARADTATLSPEPTRYLLGFGLLLPLAAWGAFLLLGRKEAERAPERLLPAVWVVAGFLVAYAPFAFQRKLIMGTHLPLAILAGLGIAHFARGARERTGVPSFAAAAVFIALLSVTTVRWLVRDTRMALDRNLTSTQLHPAYWPLSDLRAFEWIHARGGPRGAVMTYPINGVLAPAYSGRAVWSGHWGETPGYADTFVVAQAFYRGGMTSAEREAFLRMQGIRYVVLSPLERLTGPVSRPLEREPFLREVFREEAQPGQDHGTVLYEVAPGS